MKFNPYEVLGVKKDASEKSIKKAYRKRAMETHPDRGGNPEEFQAVQRAFIILSNTLKRTHYDNTGEVDEEVPDNEIAKTLKYISVAFISVVKEIAAKNLSITSLDMVALCKKQIEVTMQKPQQKLAELYRFKEIITKTKERFAPKEEGRENYLDDMVASQLQGLEQGIEQFEKEVNGSKKAIELLDQFAYLHIATTPGPEQDPQAEFRRFMRGPWWHIPGGGPTE